MIKKVNIEKFAKQYKKEYAFLYEHYDNVAGYQEALSFGDEFIGNPKNHIFIGEFCNYIHDILSSDREVAAFAFAMEALGLLD